MKNVHHRQKGVATALVLLALSVLVVLGLGLATLGTAHLHLANSYRHRQKAYYAAEAGLAAAIRMLSADSHWSEGFPETSLAQGPETYRVEVINNRSGAHPVLTSDGIPVAPSSAYLVAYGRSSGHRARAVARLKFSSTGLFRYAVFGSDGVDGGNGEVCSYDSRNPDEQHGGMSEGGADVGTLSTRPGAIALAPQARVDGDLYVGPGGDPSTVISAPAYTYRAPRRLSGPLDFPSVEIPGAGPYLGDDLRARGLLPPGNYGQVRANGDIELTAGRYVFESLEVGGGRRLRVVSWPVEIFIAGHPSVPIDLNIGGGGLVNSSKECSNVIFRVLPNAEEVEVHGSPESFSLVYAPDSLIRLDGTADFFGSLVGRSVVLKGGPTVCYDRSLSDFGNSRTELSVTAWQRL